MDSQYRIALHTQDAAWLLQTRDHHKRSLFEGACFKLALLYTIARRDNSYAFIKLYRINLELDELIAWLKRKIRQTKRAVEKKLGAALPVKVTVQATSQLYCNTVLSVKLMLVLKLFDDYVTALVHAKRAHVFAHQNDFYRFKNTIKKRVCQVLSRILVIKNEQYPPVTLQHYCDHERVYQVSAKIHGEICPQELRKALISPVTPDLEVKDLNHYLAKLS